jgi:4,5-DOPA dioxygenase extradiol
MTTPVFFVGHGSPMNALEKNAFTQSLESMREFCPNPKAILCVSAHWMSERVWITNMKNPRTIHDFYGFPQALFDIQYPAPGDPVLAERISKIISSPKINLDNEMWGYDHGTWSVLRHIFPEARVPVLQLSLYIEQPASYHYHLGTKLKVLREQGILIIGSGNMVHNLRRIKWEHNAKPYDWAIEFDEWLKSRLTERDHRALIEDYFTTEMGKLSIPTAEHYYPLLYVLGASDKNDELHFEFEEIQNGSISMRTLSFLPH